jgi:hypothetical protein
MTGGGESAVGKPRLSQAISSHSLKARTGD